MICSSNKLFLADQWAIRIDQLKSSTKNNWTLSRYWSKSLDKLPVEFRPISSQKISLKKSHSKYFLLMHQFVSHHINYKMNIIFSLWPVFTLTGCFIFAATNTSSKNKLSWLKSTVGSRITQSSVTLNTINVSALPELWNHRNLESAPGYVNCFFIRHFNRKWPLDRKWRRHENWFNKMLPQQWMTSIIIPYVSLKTIIQD